MTKEIALRITFAVDCHLTAGRRDDVEGREPFWPALDTVRSCSAAFNSYKVRCCRRTFDALKISILKINAQCNIAQLQGGRDGQCDIMYDQEPQ